MPPGELLILAAVIVAALAITAAVALTLRRLAHHRPLAVLVASLAAPALGIATTAALNWRDRAVPGDGPAMAMVGTVFLAMAALPFTVALSVWLLRRR